MIRKPSRVPTSCNPLDVVCKRRSTGTAASIGAGRRHPRPGSSSTRTGCPKRVITAASPARTEMKLATVIATITHSSASSTRRKNGPPRPVCPSP
jgi:hypothetical protein